MDILQLKYFYEVSKSLHVTHTASELHVAQPALTQTIRRLEAELGVKLFRVEGRNIALTEYGEFLKEEIGPFIHTIDELPEKLAELAEKNRSTVTVNVLAASDAVIRAIVDFRRRRRDVKIKIIQNAKDQTADVSVYTMSEYKGRERSDETYVFHEKIFLAVPENERFQSLDSISLQDVRDCDFISLAGSKPLRAICDNFCAAVGFRPNIVFESDSPQTVRDMIEMQFGVGFWPQYSWGQDTGEHIRLLPISEPAFQRDIIVGCNLQAHRGNDEPVCALKDAIVALFEKHCSAAS